VARGYAQNRSNSKWFVQCGIADLGHKRDKLLRSMTSFALRETRILTIDRALQI
jgi:hypothetical protein